VALPNPARLLLNRWTGQDPKAEQPMDTYREFFLLNNLWSSGAPWKVW
jgi:hypothetical protein